MCRFDPTCWDFAARMALLVTLLAAFAGCGGGGGGGGPDDPGDPDTRYELVVRPLGDGSVESSPAGIACGAGATQCSATFDTDTPVRLTATARIGARFVGWTGADVACDGTDCELELKRARTVSASFATDARVSERLAISIQGRGTVRSTPAGLVCAKDCSRDFPQGSKVVLTPEPHAGYRFAGWSGACGGNGSCSMTLTATRNAAARFVAVADDTRAALNVAVLGGGRVQSEPDGVDCGSACSVLFDKGRRVELSADAARGQRFVAWDGACGGSGRCRVTLDAAATVAAIFEAVPVTLAVELSGRGTVTSEPAGIQCGLTCRTELDTGASVTLAATPAAGWRFDAWGGACASTDRPSCRVQMSKERDVSARFVRIGASVELTVQGSGSIASEAAGIDCTGRCNPAFDVERTLTLTAIAGPGYRFAGWGGACDGTGSCRVRADDSVPQVSARFELEPGLGLGACVPSGKGRDYAVGDGAGQLASLDRVPWERLAAGDTVRIFHRAEPYRGKILLAARGSANAPVRVCGVKSAGGARPVIEADDAVARRGLAYTAAELDNIQEARALLLIDRLGSQDWGSAYPTHVQVDGLELRGARPGRHFTNSHGERQEYDRFGACIWIERGQGVTIADNEVHGCTNGIFSRSTDDGEFAVTRNLRIAGNYIHGNGIADDDQVHQTYLQSVDPIVEFNRYGPLLAGARGNAVKDRSAGTVIRYNRIEGGAHALDLVEAEDFPLTATSDPAYRSTHVYANQILARGETGSVIHYGGDHYGSAPGNSWGEPIYRKGTLYLFHNTIYVSGKSGALLQLSTTEERAEVWNNVFAFAPSVTYPSLRQGGDIGPAWTAGGIVNLGRNWINANWMDSDPFHTVPGEVLGAGRMLTGAALPLDPKTLELDAGSAPVDAAQAAPAAAAAFPVDFQLDAKFRKIARRVRGAAPDLGALER